MSPAPFPLTESLLAPLACWCLDTFEGLGPLLVGVEFGPDTVGFHPVHLDPVDPLSDVSTLAAPQEWAAIVLVLDVLHVASTDGPDDVLWGRLAGTLAHAQQRSGASACPLDDECGRRRLLRRPLATLVELTNAVFAETRPGTPR